MTATQNRASRNQKLQSGCSVATLSGGVFAAWFVSQTLFFCNLIVDVRRNSVLLTGRDKPAKELLRDATCRDAPDEREAIRYRAFSLGEEMRILIVPLAAAAIFATATYSSATTTSSVDDKNVLYAGAGYQLPVNMKIPALTAGVKVQMSRLPLQALALPREVKVFR
ncbi:MAG: hypothetical protein QM684_08035 [Rhizobium sp.]